MLVPICLPDLGAAELPLRVTAWFVEHGDRVEKGDRIAEVALSGITSDVKATTSGHVARFAREIDASVTPGDILLWVEAD